MAVLPQPMIQDIIRNFLKRKDILLFLGILLLGIFFARRLYQQQQGKIKALKETIAQEEEKAGVGKELAVLGDRITRISEPYLRKESSLTMDRFNELIAQAKVKVVSVSPDPQTDAGDYVKTSFRVNLRTTYHRLGRFIGLLESQPDFVKIEELSIQGLAQDTRGGSEETALKNDLNVNMKVSVIFIKEQ